MGCIIYFFLIVTFFSVSEVTLLLFVAQRTGIIFTMACCVVTGILGGYFVKQQGLYTLAKIRQTLDQGEIPAEKAIEALLLLIVGVLLCVPGFITDFLGFLIIIPFFRSIAAKILIKNFKESIKNGQFKFYSTTSTASNDQPREKNDENTDTPSANEIENATIIDVIENDDKTEREKDAKEKPL
ncbi:MAG: FxsA family protein [Candidatus Rifleibacteriota bacterium]